MSYSTVAYSAEFFSGETTNIDLLLDDCVHGTNSQILFIVSDIHSITDDGSGVFSDNLDLTQIHHLVVDSSGHSISSDSDSLAQIHILGVDSSISDVVSDALSPTQLHELIVQSSVLALSSPVLNFLAQGPKVWTGNDWRTKQIKIFRDGHWEAVSLKRWTGSDWVLV